MEGVAYPLFCPFFVWNRRGEFSGCVSGLPVLGNQAGLSRMVCMVSVFDITGEAAI